MINKSAEVLMQPAAERGFNDEIFPSSQRFSLPLRRFPLFCREALPCETEALTCLSGVSWEAAK